MQQHSQRLKVSNARMGAPFNKANPTGGSGSGTTAVGGASPTFHTVSQQKGSRRGSMGGNGANIEQERQYLSKANDQLRRCQIALFRYQKSQGKLNLNPQS